MAWNGKDLWFTVMPSEQPWLIYAAVVLLSYALGSIPFGLIFAHLGGAGDVRKIGSGNIGATNVLRTGRRGLALLTLVCDAGKGFVPVLSCRLALGFEPALFAAGGAFAGHLFPIWLNFRGGKGVATYIGVVTGLCWPAGAFFCAVWFCVAVLTRYSSLSAVIAAALTPVFALTQASPALSGLVLALSALLIARHHRNIRNLAAGKEGKIVLQAPKK